METRLDINSLKRHLFAVANSGGGKTYAIKEMIQWLCIKGKNGIIIDSQGDLWSMIKNISRESAENKEQYDLYMEKTDIKIYTPVIDVGETIKINPFDIKNRDDPYELDIKASAISNILGYSRGKESFSIKAAIYLVLKNNKLDNFDQFSVALKRIPEGDSLCNRRTLIEAARKAKSLSVGVNGLMFEFGNNLNINNMLKKEEGKSKLSIIYINGMNSDEEKQFFISYLTSEYYNWMLNNFNKDLQSFYFIDECAPYIPPVSKPASKEIIVKFAKQARKYGVSLMLATQNIVDVDYKCLSQISNWFVGRINVEQDLKRLRPQMKSMCNDPDYIMDQLPTLKEGEMFLISPDNFDKPIKYKAGQLYSEHIIIDEDEMKDLYVKPISIKKKKKKKKLSRDKTTRLTKKDIICEKPKIKKVIPREKIKIRYETRYRVKTVIQNKIKTIIDKKVIEECIAKELTEREKLLLEYIINYRRKYSNIPITKQDKKILSKKIIQQLVVLSQAYPSTWKGVISVDEEANALEVRIYEKIREYI